jgi:hypothetical protein
MVCSPDEVLLMARDCGLLSLQQLQKIDFW